jgi:hypothetical protein
MPAPDDEALPAAVQKLSQYSRQLEALDRYERRASSPRKFAIRDLDAAMRGIAMSAPDG